MTDDELLTGLLDAENAGGGHGRWRGTYDETDEEMLAPGEVHLTDDDGCILFVDEFDVAALVQFALSFGPKFVPPLARMVEAHRAFVSETGAAHSCRYCE